MDCGKLFGYNLSKKLETRILELLDLQSLAACRLVNSRWQTAVDNLSSLWSGLTHRLGIADTCDSGRERWRAQKMLGDCWITSSFCPIVKESDILEGGLQLACVSLCFNSTDKLKVTAFSPRSASLHCWELRVPNVAVQYKGCRFMAGDWIAILEVQIVDDSENQQLNKSPTDECKQFTLELTETPEKESSNYVFAIVPVHRTPTGEVSPLALVQKLDSETQLCCVIRKCKDCNENQLLLLTSKRLQYYNLPSQSADEKAKPSVLKESRDVYTFPSEFEPILLRRVLSSVNPTSHGVANFFVYLKKRSPIEDILRIDHVQLNCQGMVYTPGEPLMFAKHLVHTIDSDDCPVFIFPVTATKSIGGRRDSQQKKLQLVRYGIRQSGGVTANPDPCEYDNPFLPVSSMTIHCFAVGRLFWHCIGTRNSNDVSLAIYRVGCPDVLTFLSLDIIIPDHYFLGRLNSIRCFSASWIDFGFEPDNPEQTPLIVVNWQEKVQLLLGWRFNPPSQPLSVLCKHVRFSCACLDDWPWLSWR